MQKERRLAGTLSPHNRLIDTVCAGLNVDGAIIQEASAWGNALLLARNAWADTNRNGRRYSDRETTSNSLPERPARRW